MLYLALYLRRTGCVVGTVMGSLAIDAYKRSAALRALGDEEHLLAQHETRTGIHSSYLRNYLTAFLYIDHVAYVKVEFLYYVGIMQRCALYYSSGKLYRVEVCDRCHHTSAAYLIGNLVKTCDRPLGLELVRYCPTRRLCRVAQVLLLTERIHLQNNTVCCKRQVLAL